jgi:hypothetical protein
MIEPASPPPLPSAEREPALNVRVRSTNPLRKAELREQLIRQMTAHILEHRGPDERECAHPTLKSPKLEFLEEALTRARELGLSIPESSPIISRAFPDSGLSRIMRVR